MKLCPVQWYPSLQKTCWICCRHRPSSVLWHNHLYAFLDRHQRITHVTWMTTSSCIPMVTCLIYGHTAPPAPVQDHYDQLLTFLFLEGVPGGVCGLRLLTHIFPTRIRGRLGLFPCFTPSHTPFPTIVQHQNTCKTSSCGNCQLPLSLVKNKLTNIWSEKKKTQWRVPPEAVAWHMGFIRKRGLTLWVRGVWNMSIPYFIWIHLSSSKSYQLSITDSRLSTVGW